MNIDQDQSPTDVPAVRDRRSILRGAALAAAGIAGTRLVAEAADREASPAAASVSMGTVGVKVGQIVSVQASGYLPNEELQILWFQDGTPTTVKTVVANSSGARTTTFLVPAATSGSHVVRVRGTVSSRKADATLTVQPSLSGSFYFKKTGEYEFVQAVRPKLLGFGAMQTVSLKFYRGDVLALSLNVPTSNLGSGGEPFYPISPVLAPGKYTVKARVGSGPVLASSIMIMPTWE